MPSTRQLPSIQEHDDDTALLKSPTSTKTQGGILSTKVADACLDWVVFPALLFVQFGATMYCQMKEGLSVMDWKLVHATILAFCMVAGIYRQVLRKNSDSIVLLLLPEIFTNILLAMVMLGPISLAYIMLVVLTATLGVLGSVLAYWSRGPEQPEDYLRLNEDEEGEDENGTWVC